MTKIKPQPQKDTPHKEIQNSSKQPQSDAKHLQREVNGPQRDTSVINNLKVTIHRIKMSSK